MEKIIAGVKLQIGEVKRMPIALREQEEILQEKYEGYDFISVSHGVIRFYYTKERDSK